LVSGNVLMSELAEYVVQRWTKESIVLGNDGECAEEIYSIDLNTKAVSGAGRRIHSDDPICKVFASAETEWATGWRVAPRFTGGQDEGTTARASYAPGGLRKLRHKI
jgi:hypothetical protein